MRKKQEFIPKDIAEMLYLQFYPVIFRKILSLTQDQYLAADITQEAFIIAFQRFSQLRNQGHFKSWVLKIAVNQLRALHRKPKREFLVETPPTAASLEPLPEEMALRYDQQRNFKNALKQLPDKMYMVVVLNYMEEMSIQEVASTLKLRTGTVKSRLARARKRLQQILGSHQNALAERGLSKEGDTIHES